MTLKGDSKTSELDPAAALGATSRLYALHDTGSGLEDRAWVAGDLLELLGRERIGRQQGAGVGSFEVALPSGYRGFELVGWLSFAAAVDLRYPALILSPDGGTSWRESSGNYEWAHRYSWTGSASSHENAHAPGSFAGSPGTDAIGLGVNHMANRRSSLFLTLLAAGAAGVRTAAFWRSAMHHNLDSLRTADGGGFCRIAEVHDRLRIFDTDGGNDITFDLTLYGLR